MTEGPFQHQDSSIDSFRYLSDQHGWVLRQLLDEQS